MIIKSDLFNIIFDTDKCDNIKIKFFDSEGEPSELNEAASFVFLVQYCNGTGNSKEFDYFADYDNYELACKAFNNIYYHMAKGTKGIRIDQSGKITVIN